MNYKSYDNETIYYNKIGKGEKLILLHGLGSNHTTLLKIANKLKHKYTLILPDLRGHGKSTTKNLSMSSNLKDLYILIKKEKIKHPIIIGNSYGANIAYHYNDMFKTKATVLINPLISPHFRFKKTYTYAAKLLRLLPLKYKIKPINYNKVKSSKIFGTFSKDLKTQNPKTYSKNMLISLNNTKQPKIKTNLIVLHSLNDKIIKKSLRTWSRKNHINYLALKSNHITSIRNDSVPQAILHLL